MDIVGYNHAINAFMDEMNENLHSVCIPFYTRKSEYPIDGDLIYWHCVLLCALYLKLEKLEIDRTLIDSLFPEEGSFQRIIWVCNKLARSPLDAYVATITEMIAKSAMAKSASIFVKTPDFRPLKDAIKPAIKNSKKAAN